MRLCAEYLPPFTAFLYSYIHRKEQTACKQYNGRFYLFRLPR